MLDVSAGIVSRLIDLAREFHGQEEVAIEDEPESLQEEWQSETLEPYGADPILEEFCSVVADLNPDQQQQIVGLLWLGRGDYEIDEWDDALDYAADAWNEQTGEYLLAHPMLAEYLTIGLKQHGYACD